MEPIFTYENIFPNISDHEESPAWLENCREPSLTFYGNNIQDWNETLMEELYSRGCNCDVIVDANGPLGNFMCTDHVLKHSLWVQLIYILLFCTIVVFSVGGNLTVIWIVLWHRRMREIITNYFLLNLAIADSSISIFNVCFSFTYNLYYDWYFGNSYCTFNNFMGVAPTSASVFTLMAMSLDRYVAIVYPLSRRRLSKANTIIIIVIIWIAATLCGLPMLLCSRTIQFFLINGRKHTVCLADNYSDGDAKTSFLFVLYNYFLLVVNYLLPLAVLTLTYIRVGIALWGSESIGDHRHDESVRTKRKVVKMMIAVVSIFMISWFPYHAYFTMFMHKFSEMPFEHVLHIYLNMYMLAMSSTIYNPIIYCWMNSRFRIGFKYAFRWLPFITISAEEYLESDLHRDRLTNNSTVAACRRRSDMSHNRLLNGDTPSPYHNSRRRRTAEVILNQFEQDDNLSDNSSPRTALLYGHRRSVAFGTWGNAKGTPL